MMMEMNITWNEKQILKLALAFFIQQMAGDEKIDVRVLLQAYELAGIMDKDSPNPLYKVEIEELKELLQRM